MKNIDIIKKKLHIKDIFNGEIIKTSFGWKSLCPFHKDTDPSFQVTEKETGDVFYCFGCKTSGSVIDYIQNTQNFDIHQAIEYASELLGIEYEKYQYINKYDSIIRSLKRDHSFFLQRGISREVLDRFDVGYIDDMSLYNLDKNLLTTDNMLIDVNDSIFYPIKQRNSKCIGYYIRPVTSGKNKYIGNSPIQLFGLDQFDNTKGYVILVEGHNDVLKLHTVGIKNVLGLCGTNWNYDIVKVLDELRIYRVIILPDSDAGGEKFVNRLLSIYGTFDHKNVSVSIAWMHGFEGDPDDYVDQNRQFFDNIVDSSTPIVQMIFDEEKKVHQYDIDCLNKIMSERPYVKSHELQLTLKDKIGNLVIDKTTKTFYNIEYEKIILGSAIIDAVARSVVVSTMTNDDFVISEHKNIFDFISTNKNTTLETIKSCFGIQFDMFDAGNIKYYIDYIQVYTKKRKLWNVLGKYDYSILEKTNNIEPIFASLVNDIVDAASTSNIVQTMTSDDVIVKTIDEINSDAFDGPSVALRMPNLSSLTRGLPSGNLIIVGANTGVGKTSFALNLVDMLSYEQNYTSLFLTAEMSPSDLMLRQLSIRSGLSYNGIIDRKIQLPYDQLEKMNNKRVIYSKIPFIEDVRNNLEIMYAKHGRIDVIFFDYLQLARSRDGRSQRYEQLTDLTLSLKSFAGDYNCSIVALAQLTKNNTSEDISKIKNIAGAYNMIADADIGITLNTMKSDNQITDGNFEIVLDKMRRNTGQIIIPAYYDKSCLRITEMSILRGQHG